MFQHITSWSIDSCISDSTTWHPPPVYSVRNVLGMLRKKTDEQNEKILVLEMLRKQSDEKILVLGMLRKKTDEKNEKILLEDLS